MVHVGLALKPCIFQRRSQLNSSLKPYWGKPDVRNFRGGAGNVMQVMLHARACSPLGANLCPKIKYVDKIVNRRMGSSYQRQNVCGIRHAYAVVMYCRLDFAARQPAAFCSNAKRYVFSL